MVVVIPLLAFSLLAPPPSRAEIRAHAIEVKAKLIEIPGKPPPNDLYDYAYVMKYEVIGGNLDGKKIYVAHFNPLKPRSRIQDEMKKWVGGKLRHFREGDLHQMTITPHVDAIWTNAVEDHYFDIDRKSTRYWCLEVSRAH
jgi:hypothetical protein